MNQVYELLFILVAMIGTFFTGILIGMELGKLKWKNWEKGDPIK